MIRSAAAKALWQQHTVSSTAAILRINRNIILGVRSGCIGASRGKIFAGVGRPIARFQLKFTLIVML